MRSRAKILSAAAALTAILLLPACASSTEPEAAPTALPAVDADVDALGGQEAADALDELYQAAIDAGETTVTIYGPGETDKQAIYDEIFSKRFPKLSVTGVYILGPDYAAKMEGEFASGQHVADLVQIGDTSVVPGLANDYFEKFQPVTAEPMDATYSDESGSVWAASGTAFGFMYNTTKISKKDAPAGWDDLLAPALKGQIATDDATKNGAGFGTLSHLLWDGGYDAAYMQDLAAQEIAFQASAPAAGTAVATGEYALQAFYPMPFFLRDKAQGAPVEYVFPTEGGSHISPHYLGLVNGAPNANAAKLLMSWLFTPEAQQAMAEIGYYPLMPGEPGPEGYPPADELDLLKPFTLAEVGQASKDNLAVVKSAFGG